MENEQCTDQVSETRTITCNCARSYNVVFHSCDTAPTSYFRSQRYEYCSLDKVVSPCHGHFLQFPQCTEARLVIMMAICSSSCTIHRNDISAFADGSGVLQQQLCGIGAFTVVYTEIWLNFFFAPCGFNAEQDTKTPFGCRMQVRFK